MVEVFKERAVTNYILGSERSCQRKERKKVYSFIE